MNDEEIKTLFNVVDKLEKRIFLLEKVLESHAKQIGQLREEEKDEWIKILSRAGVSYLNNKG